MTRELHPLLAAHVVESLRNDVAAGNSGAEWVSRDAFVEFTRLRANDPSLAEWLHGVCSGGCSDQADEQVEAEEFARRAASLWARNASR